MILGDTGLLVALFDPRGRGAGLAITQTVRNSILS
jgi:hypothetical protein